MLCIGVGNAYRRDDAAGLEVAARLHGTHVTARQLSGEGAQLMLAWHGAPRVVIVDAVSSDGTPGTVYRLDVSAEPLPARFFRCSSHTFGVAEAVEMARVLDELPPELIVFGIEGADFGEGVGLSPSVAAAVADVALRIQCM
jgi:hydrogenase maturation protease